MALQWNVRQGVEYWWQVSFNSILLNLFPLNIHSTNCVSVLYSNYATMRFNPEALHGANNGLAVARGVLEPIKKEFPWISYGDLWTLGGVAAIQVSSHKELAMT
jgi:hypothetical protein